jgi:hypothetical protein
MKIYSLLLILAPLVLATGCGSGDIIDPKVEIPKERRLVVVPFRTAEYDNGFDSERVLELYEEGNGNPKNLTAREVAEKTKADYVLMGDVVSWRHADENTFGLKRGSSSVDITLYETALAAKERLKDTEDADDLPKNGRGRLALRKVRVSASFPNEYGMKEIGNYDLSDEQIENGLLNSSALQIAWLLVPHTKDEEKLMAGK